MFLRALSPRLQLLARKHQWSGYNLAFPLNSFKIGRKRRAFISMGLEYNVYTISRHSQVTAFPLIKTVTHLKESVTS